MYERRGSTGEHNGGLSGQQETLTMTEFKYLGRVLNTLDDHWPVVVAII